jgi:UDP-glucose 4-epimerase
MPIIHNTYYYTFMKCLVTGGAGFIGSHIQDNLIELGHDVAVVDNLRSGKKENLNSKTQFFEVDVTKKDALNEVFVQFQPEVVFHLAAQNEVPYSMEHPFEDEQMNIVGMMNLCESAVKNGTKKIIYSNTGGAFYGDVPDSALPIKEDQPVTKPTSFYGVSKGSAESYLKLYGNLHGLQWVSLRYSNVYGPRQAGNGEAGVIAIFTSKMLSGEAPTINGQGEHTRDYVYVGDVVEANIKALDFEGSDYFNIATGGETSNLEVFQTIENELNSGMKANFGPNRPGDALHVYLDPGKAQEKLGWRSQVSFADGVKKTVEYYRKAASGE